METKEGKVLKFEENSIPNLTKINPIVDFILYL